MRILHEQGLMYDPLFLHLPNYHLQVFQQEQAKRRRVLAGHGGEVQVRQVGFRHCATRQERSAQLSQTLYRYACPQCSALTTDKWSDGRLPKVPLARLWFRSWSVWSGAGSRNR